MASTAVDRVNIQARVGQRAAAFATLDQMFSVPGFYDERWVQRDPGFAALRSRPTFRAHIDRWSSQEGRIPPGAPPEAATG